MTTPISSSNSSVYDPSAQMSFADGTAPAMSMAALSCAKAGVTAVAGGLSAATLVGALPAAAITLVESISCGEDLATYFECENP
jgi:hypothetical protein